MITTRKIEQIVGILFIVQLVAAILSYSVILEPILLSVNFLTELSDNATMVTVAMFFDIICGASVFTIAVLLFPILKQHSERIALWYVGERLTELISFMISGLLLMTMMKIGQDITNAPSIETSHLEALGRYLREARGNIQEISLLIYCLGAWSFYGLLYFSKIVPGFISLWGLVGVTLLFIEIMANIFNTTAGGILIMMPLGLNEVFIGLWLIFKGFNPSSVDRGL